MAHTCKSDLEMICRECEKDELFATAASTETQGGPRICRDCGEQLSGRGWQKGYCFDCEREKRESADGLPSDLVVSLRALLAFALLCVSAVGQTAYSGRGASSGLGTSGAVSAGAPQTYSARTDNCETGAESGCVANPLCPSCTGTGQPMTFLGFANSPPVCSGASCTLPVSGPATGSSCGTQPANGQYLCGMNTTAADPDLHAQVVRATDYTLSSTMGVSFNLGSDGSLHRWASDSSKLLINNDGGAYSVLAFYPSQWGGSPVKTSRLVGGAALTPGGIPSFSPSNPHVIYELNTDQENTVVGSVTSVGSACVTPETMQQATTGATATLQAINPNVLMQLGEITGTGNGTSAWTGQTSGCVFTPGSPFLVPATGTATPYANTIYSGFINDATQPDPMQWTITWSLVFNFNYLPAMAGTPAASYFPTSATSCLPANFSATWNGIFLPSDDGNMIGTPFSDNGQSGGWCSNWKAGGCIGPSIYATYKQGAGCRTLNTHTDQITGDWGPSGQAMDGQHNYILGTLSGTPAVGAMLTQATTGATAQFFCAGNLMTNQTAPSGYSYNQYVCGGASPNSWKVGLIYGTADATHAWSDGTNTLTPPAPNGFAPTNVPFYYPAEIHDANQTANPSYAWIGLAASPNAYVTEVQGATPVAGQTTITFSKAINGWPVDRQVVFYNLTGGNGNSGGADGKDSYLNCPGLNQWCPAFNIVSGTSGNGTTNTIVIQDTANPNGAYDDHETQASNCASQNTCQLMAPNGIGFIAPGYSFFSDPNYWYDDPTQPASLSGLAINTCNSTPECQGHSAIGYTGGGNATQYTWHSFANPSLPCTVTGYTPCPTGNAINLLPANVPEGQHGSYLNHGPSDQTPLFLFLANPCGQGSGNTPCKTSYDAAWDSEVIGVQNTATNSSATGLTYRFARTFNGENNWGFNEQNSIGTVSPDGQFAAFPSSWMNTLGCTNGTTQCWGSYVASGPPTASQAGATIQTDANGVITVTMPNGFCPPNGNQYYWYKNAVVSIACGALAEQVTLSGFAESWANQTITLTAVGGCDSTDSNAGNCTSFSGTGTGVPDSYGPVTESSGTQKAMPVSCLGGGGLNTYCQRSDIWIVKLGSAHP